MSHADGRRIQVSVPAAPYIVSVSLATCTGATLIVHGSESRAAHRQPRARIDESGNLRLRLGSGRVVALNIKENPHLDYGYAVTSHSSQGQTTDRVLIHVDAEQAGEKLINRRLADVALSRGRYDAQLYTNDKTHLTEQLARDVSRRCAMEQARMPEFATQKIELSLSLRQGAAQTVVQELNIGR